MRNYKVRKFFKVIAVFLCLVMIGSVLTYCFYTPFKNYVNKTFNIKTKQTSTITKEPSNDANYEIIESFETQLKNMEFQIGDFEERLLAYENTAISNSGTFANIKKQLDELTTDLNTLKSDYESTNEENTAAISGLRTSLAEANTTLDILASNISNPNLLINGDFRVNQRGQKTYSTAGTYTIDRWMLESGSVTVSNLGITLNGTLIQILEHIPTQTCIASVDKSNGNVECGYEDGVFSITASGILIKWAKLELGSISTVFTPKTYTSELLDCQRYYFRYSSTTTSHKQIAIGLSNGPYCYFAISFNTAFRTLNDIKFDYSDIDCFNGVSGGAVEVTELILTSGVLENNQLTIRAAVSGVTAKDVLMLRIKQGGTGFIEFDAEIY